MADTSSNAQRCCTKIAEMGKLVRSKSRDRV
jgi:hypothetical protein